MDLSNIQLEEQVQQTSLVSTMAYLVGVRRGLIDKPGQDTRLLESLAGNDDAIIMRSLCNIRSNLMLYFSRTEREMRNELKNLDRQSTYSEDINILYSKNVNIIKANYTVNKYLADINLLINNRLEKIRPLFPEWVNWEYIKDLFVMPKGQNENAIKAESTKFQQNQGYYPFKRYIHWIPEDEGNILYTDKKFINIIYRQHNDYFEDPSKFQDAGEEVKGNIYDFIRDAQTVMIMVDCENSDPYKLAATLTQLDEGEIAKIKKIVLFDDEHTTRAWSYLKPLTKIDVEHHTVERINNYKSLVDGKMMLAIQKAFLKEEADSFILLSSDSDYWAVISELPEAKFLVMIEEEKCGPDIKRAMDEHDIYYCYIDDFYTGKISEFKNAVLLTELRDRMAKLVNLNATDLVNSIYLSCRVDASEAEKKNFYDRYIKKLSMMIDDNDTLKIRIPD